MECNQITQAINLLQGLIPTSSDEGKSIGQSHLKKIFVFAIMWSLGAVLELDDRKKVCVGSVFVVYFFNYIDNSFFDLRLFAIDWFNFVSLSGAKMFLSNVFTNFFIFVLV